MERTQSFRGIYIIVASGQLLGIFFKGPYYVTWISIQKLRLTKTKTGKTDKKWEEISNIWARVQKITKQASSTNLSPCYKNKVTSALISTLIETGNPSQILERSVGRDHGEKNPLFAFWISRANANSSHNIRAAKRSIQKASSSLAFSYKLFWKQGSSEKKPKPATNRLKMHFNSNWQIAKPIATRRWNLSTPEQTIFTSLPSTE